jgi:hypothetical protein
MAHVHNVETLKHRIIAGIGNVTPEMLKYLTQGPWQEKLCTNCDLKTKTVMAEPLAIEGPSAVVLAENQVSHSSNMLMSCQSSPRLIMIQGIG